MTANTSYKQNGVPVSIPSGSYGIAPLTVHQYEYPKGHPCHTPTKGGLTMYENDGGLLSPRDAYRLMLKDYPDVMDIVQMCEALGVSTKTGYKLLKDGKIEYLKIGRAYRIPKAHILRYLKITCSTLAE